MIPFLAEAVLISLSGVLAPGPLSASTVAHGNRSPHAGAVVAMGHGIVEFPLMAMIVFGFATIVDVDALRPILLLAAGLVLLWMSVGMLRLARRPVSSSASDSTHSPLWSGIILTGANPYFLMWWATVGAGLLVRASDHGWVGLLAFAVAHWVCDLVWLWLMSAAVFAGGKVLGDRFSQIVYGLCGLFLLFAAVDFLIDGWQRFSAPI
ncbi:MAG: LysE family transporter [Gemmatimonadetes bacterium]|nr:LysE family transporter [Gemmatimonadota bacterium]MBT5587902.1 LysE family transporter [Gemmatimonadota bacterium]